MKEGESKSRKEKGNINKKILGCRNSRYKQEYLDKGENTEELK